FLHSSSAAMHLLLTLLGAVLSSLMVSSEVQPQADFDVQAVRQMATLVFISMIIIAGKWYLIGIATDAQWFVSHRASMKMGTAMITPTADGDVEMSYSSLSPNGSCWRMNNLAKKTEIPGKFTYTSRRWGYLSDLRMVDVKYDEYALIHSIKTKGKESYVVNKLYGRGVDLSAEVQEKFIQFSLQSSIQPENIVILPKNDECPAA
uniref:Zgc:153704 n=1 Tax=Oreochromis niloticus TaxID=8128 RepID=A0A669CKA0_ORENI